jgi:DNA helicase-2/ATP-dependent DNA helicase PcrA
VLAGAGTGKTRVLTTRLAHLITTGRARPGEVLCVTFTNKAAREMGERVEALIGRGVQGMWLGTFHAIGVRMLRAHAELAGLKSSFTILDTDDQERLVKQVIQAADLDERRWPPGCSTASSSAGRTAAGGRPGAGLGARRLRARPGAPASTGPTRSACRAERLRLRRPAAAQPHHPRQASRTSSPSTSAASGRSSSTSTRTPTSPSTCGSGSWPARTRTSPASGDDDQSIYSWRGAEVGNILRFEQDFPGASIIRLERNYRSTGHILGAASGVIAHNRTRHGKTCGPRTTRASRSGS